MNSDNAEHAIDHAHWLRKMRRHGYNLANAPEQLKTDKAIVLAAVEQNGRALQHAAEALKTDREVVLSAVKQDALAFFFASCDLQADRVIQAYAGIGVPSLIDEVESGEHSFDADTLEQLNDAALFATMQCDTHAKGRLARRPRTNASVDDVERFAQVVFAPEASVHKKLEREWCHMMATGSAA